MGWQDDPVIKPVGKETKSAWENDPIIKQAPPAQLKQYNRDEDRGIFQQDKNVFGGLIRGAGSIGSTILYSYDRIKGGGREGGLRLNTERLAAIDSGLQELIGSNPDSAGYKTGKIGSEIMGTAGVGNVLAKGVQALPMLSKAVPNLAPALRSGGLSVAQKATTPLGMAGNAATRIAAGGTTGYGMAGLVNPEEAKTGAIYGALLPGVVKGAGESGVLLNKGGKAVSRRLMQSALKPTIKQLKTGDARMAVDTLLDYGVNPNQRGVEKLRGVIDDINTDITGRVANSKATVNKLAVSSYLDDVRSKFGNQVSPTSDLNAINAIGDDFMSQASLPGNNLSVQMAQKLKTGTYRALAGKYGETGSAATEAQKSLARGLKDEIAFSVPGIDKLNAEEARLLKTLGVTERRALMELNKNPVGLSVLAGNPVGFAAFMADRSAAFKALAARSINRASSVPGYVPKLSNQLANPLLRGGLLSIPAD